MGDVFRLRVTDAQQALARYREEARSFRIVLHAAAEWRRSDLFVRVFSLYRSRMLHLRKVLGPLLAGVELRSVAEELRELGGEPRAPGRPRSPRRGRSSSSDPLP